MKRVYKWVSVVKALCLINMSSMMCLFFVNSLISPIQRSINLQTVRSRKKWFELRRIFSSELKHRNQNPKHSAFGAFGKKDKKEMESKSNKNKIDQYIILLWSEEKSLLLYSCNNFVNIAIKTRHALTEDRKVICKQLFLSSR